MTRRKGDPPTNTRLEKIKYLCEGSPKLRYQLVQIRDSILRKSNPSDTQSKKLLGVEDCPYVGWFWELVVQSLYINARVVHAGLSLEERNKLIREFNDPNSGLDFLYIMYNVSVQGLNLDKSCCRVLILCAAVNAALEVQGWGRTIRVCSVLVRVEV
jgi:Helicase conserved C-terminal domain